MESVQEVEVSLLLGGALSRGGEVMILHLDDEADVLRAADVVGFTLRQRELDTGQVAWSWIASAGGPQPRFLTRREAIAFIGEKLGTL
jgi:hypothetical protein